jgi:hypothetical protein
MHMMEVLVEAVRAVMISRPCHMVINVVRFPFTLWYPHYNNSSTFRDPPAGNCDVAYWKIMVGPLYLGECWWLYIPILIRVSSRPQFCFSYHRLIMMHSNRISPFFLPSIKSSHYLPHVTQIKEANYNSTFYFFFHSFLFPSFLLYS